MNYDETLVKIIRKYGAQTGQIRMAQIIESKLTKHTATYADAEKYAQEIGKALTDAFREYLPEALTDGMLYRAAAEVLVKQPMMRAGGDVAEIASRIQKQLNENAGIGMNAIIPEMNQDQIDGIITGICNADSYESGKEKLFDQVENCMEGYVDDFVRENADFQYKAGLSPKIERRADAKCCEWCSRLAGIYEYADVSNKGNDVFRRHRNCHCVVMYNPGDGSKRRQNAHSRQWTESSDPATIAARRKVGLEAAEYRKKPAFNSKADPMAEVTGRGIDSHPDEIKAFREECRQSGVNIIEREHETLNYQPNARIGRPGQISISPDASYAAWCHEMQHMRDDRDSGWDGALKAWDKDEHIKREEKAYGIEIRMAEELGRTDIADRLRENLEAERRRIYDSP